MRSHTRSVEIRVSSAGVCYREPYSVPTSKSACVHSCNQDTESTSHNYKGYFPKHFRDRRTDSVQTQ